jgi:hypothetical protein
MSNTPRVAALIEAGQAIVAHLTEQIDESCGCEDCETNMAERELIQLGLVALRSQAGPLPASAPAITDNGQCMYCGAQTRPSWNPQAGSDPICGVPHPPTVCGREPGHDGAHIARDVSWAEAQYTTQRQGVAAGEAIARDVAKEQG